MKKIAQKKLIIISNNYQKTLWTGFVSIKLAKKDDLILKEG